MLNLATYLDTAASRYPNQQAVVLDEMRFSYREVAAFARKAASVLREKGVGHGDRVALMMPNIPYFPILYYAILRLGAVVVPVNVLFQKYEILHCLRDSGAKAFLSFNLFAEQAEPAFEEAAGCKHLIQAGPLGWMDKPAVGENLMHLLPSAEDDLDCVQTAADDTAVILYTSGTTGAPKGAQLTHSNMVMNAMISGQVITKLRPGEVGLATLPLFHSFGQTCLMNTCVLMGATMTLLPRFETQKALEIIQRDRVAVVALVPTMYAYLLNAEGDYDLSSIRCAVSGGAALPEEVHRRFKERFGITILEGYGLSETSPVASFTLEGEELRVGSIGKPILGVEMRIRREDGSFAGPEELGEVVIRGHNIMKGYFGRPEATAEAIRDGWFHTGDIGRCDADGYFYIVDRKKDLIIRGGMNIYPREIEELLFTHPKVFEVAVVGIPDPLRGEEVKVFVTPVPGSGLTPDEVSAFIEAHLARFKWPKAVELMKELPKGPTGKILKRVLRERGA